MDNQPDQFQVEGFDMDALIAQVGEANHHVDGPGDESNETGGGFGSSRPRCAGSVLRLFRRMLLDRECRWWLRFGKPRFAAPDPS